MTYINPLTYTLEFTTSYHHYLQLSNYFLQLTSLQGDPEGYEKRKEYYDKHFRTWEKVDSHVVLQTWSNTSGGWEGIGGSTITTNPTVVFQHNFSKSLFVYYSGKLAYVTEYTERFKEYLGEITDFTKLPGYSTVSTELDLLYKAQR